MISPISIDHICLIVRSLKITRTYYERIFDFSYAQRPNAPGTLMVESPFVHFFITEEPEAPSFFLSKQHLSFEVLNINHVINKLEEIVLKEYVTGEFNLFQYRNYKWCEWRDPDGIRLECVQRL